MERFKKKIDEEQFLENTGFEGDDYFDIKLPKTLKKKKPYIAA